MGSSQSSRCAAALAALICAAWSAAPASAETIWLEGEKPAAQNVTRHPFWYDQVKKNELSGGDWISNWDEKKAGTLSYSFSVPKAGTYTLWLRANPTSTTLSYQIDNGKQTEVSFAGASDNRNIAANDAIDLRFIAWVRVGKVELAQGNHSISFRMSSQNNNHGAIDCIVFTDEPFIPQGTSRPGQGGAVAQAVSTDGNWAFVVPEDAYKSDALMDLSSLNEKVAGEKGYITRSKDGMDFVRGDGQPIRFWGVVSNGSEMNPDDMEEHCRWLAKRGVNMVRLHRTICDTKEGAKITDVNQKDLDGIFRFVSVAKKHGIYVTLSSFWAHATAPKSWGLEDYAGKQVWGLMYFNDDLKNAYKAWTKQLYTTVNPYTGIALKDDPSIAIVQIKNEDSLLFWTFDGISGAQKRLLQKKYGDWLVKEYGSLDKALVAWGGQKIEGDDSAGGRMAFEIIWKMTTQPEQPFYTPRLRDQTEFLGRLQYDFYAEIEQHYRGMGCKQLINAMNWRSADQVVLDDIERWTYTANQVSAVNFYTGGTHVGQDNGWRINPGHFLTSESVLKNPNTLPCNLKQTLGLPMMITETSWTDPALYQTEGPFLHCAYQSLSGVDVTYWFAYGNPGYEMDPRYTFANMGGHYALHKWSGNTPQQAGMFPAFALAFRNSYIKQAPQPAVYEERKLEDMWERKVPIISESGRFDPNRDQGAFAKESPIKQEVDRLAFLVGPVHVRYGGDPKNNKVADLSKYIDRNAGTVKSLTGEIALNYKSGVCTINAPAIQGVSGFLKDAGGQFQFANVTVASQNDYATIATVSMDGKPLNASAKVLIQVGTTSKTTGWATKKAKFKADGKEVEGEEVVATGTAPWQIAHTKATITISNPGLSKATLLDVNGYAVKAVPAQKVGDKLTVTLPENAMYVIVQ